MREGRSPIDPPGERNKGNKTPIPPVPVEKPQPQLVRVRLPGNRPMMTYIILGVTILFFLLQEASRYFYQQDVVAFYAEKINWFIVQGQLWRLITPILVHADILHIGFNMYALYVFGKSLERFYGPWKFLSIYLVSGFAGVVASFVLTEGASLGASTAIFGLLAAQGVFAYQNREVFGHQAQRVLKNIFIIAAINLALGLSPGIDNWGHLGGLIGGLLVSWFGGPKYAVAGTAEDLYLEDQRKPQEFILAILGTGLAFGLIVLGVFAVINFMG